MFEVPTRTGSAFAKVVGGLTFFSSLGQKCVGANIDASARDGWIKVILNATNYGVTNMMHTSTLRAAGGSIAVTIPQAMARATGLHPGDKVSFEFDAGRLIVSPVNRRKYSLSELLAMQGGEPLLIDKAWDTMPASGQEVAV